MSTVRTMGRGTDRTGNTVMDAIFGKGRAMLARLAIATTIVAAAAAAPAVAAESQRTFATPDEAVGALVQSLKARDKAGTAAILGPGSGAWLGSGDAVADRAAVEGFVASYEKKHAIVPDGDARAKLTIGDDDWPFAFPLEKVGGRWRFDTVAGKDEMLARRIGRNELDVINVMLAIVDAQRDYASVDRDGNRALEYARKFLSGKGKHDGLYWPEKAGEAPSPLGPLMTTASGEGYALGKSKTPTPYHGYHFRMLTAQGPAAPGGALDYVVRGRMIGGFAAIATPAKYGSSGIMTFIVSHDGVVYEKDLGPQTASKAAAIRKFDPGQGWTAVPAK
jgi:hypothetical protein